MNEKLTAFLKAIIKYGGANLVLLLVAAYFFDSFFHIDPNIVSTILNLLLWVLLGETLLVLIVGRFFWIMEKWRDFKAGKSTATDMNGVSTVEAAKVIGIEAIVALKDKLSKSPEEKAKIAVEKIEEELAKLEEDLSLSLP